MSLLLSLSWRRGLAEFGIIVVGILIALAADDWYAGIQQREQEIAWVTGIRDDLLADHANLQQLLEQTDQSTQVIRGLIASIDDPSLEIDDTLAYLRELKRAVITYFFRPTSTTYTELTGGGSLSVISNRALTRAVINYHQAALLTEDLNDVIRQAKWVDYGQALSGVIEPTLIPDLTEDWYREANQWPPDGDSSPLESLTAPVDLSRLRASDEFRTVLASSLDFTFVQRGDLYRMLRLCEEVLELTEAELSRLIS